MPVTRKRHNQTLWEKEKEELLQKISDLKWVRISIVVFITVLAYGTGQIRPSQFNTVQAVETKIIHTNTTTVEPIYTYPDRDLVIDEIVAQAKVHDVSVGDALEIARCESRYKAFAESGISSATGVFQFIDGTWENYCEGDRMNFKDNVKCFMELYPKYPQWWECKA